MGFETLKRWKDAALRIQGEPPTAQGYQATGYQTGKKEDDTKTFELGNAMVQEAPATPSQLDLSGRPEGTDDGGSLPRWPDPRAAIALTREASNPSPKAPVASLPNRRGATRLAEVSGSWTTPTAASESSSRISQAISIDRHRGVPMSQANAPLSLDEELKRRFGGNVRSALGPGTIIEGTFSFDSPVCVDGTLLGEVRSSSVLIVGERAIVKGTIKVGSLLVCGHVKGPVEALDLIEIKAGGSIEGDIVSQRLIVEDGGWFQGRCTPTVRPLSEQVDDDSEGYDDDDDEEMEIE